MSTIEASAASGAIAIANVGSLTVGSTLTKAVNGLQATGAIDVATSGALTIAKSVLTPGAVFLVAQPGTVASNITVNGQDLSGKTLQLISGGVLQLLAAGNNTVSTGVVIDARDVHHGPGWL